MPCGTDKRIKSLTKKLAEAGIEPTEAQLQQARESINKQATDMKLDLSKVINREYTKEELGINGTEYNSLTKYFDSINSGKNPTKAQYKAFNKVKDLSLSDAPVVDKVTEQDSEDKKVESIPIPIPTTSDLDTALQMVVNANGNTQVDIGKVMDNTYTHYMLKLTKDELNNAIKAIRNAMANNGKMTLIDKVRYKKLQKAKIRKEADSSKFTNDLTDEQKVVFKDVVDFMREDGRQEHIIDSAGGTGKTKLMGNVAKMMESEGQHIIYLAPTHAAVAVLKQSLKDSGFKDAVVKTTASGLGIRMNDATGEFTKDPYAHVAIGSDSVVVVDESSMITESIQAELLDHIPKGKVVWMGDQAQLPPIRSNLDKKMYQERHGMSAPEGAISPVLIPTRGVKVNSMKKVMRFDDKSALGNITKKMRDEILVGDDSSPLGSMDGKDSHDGTTGVSYVNSVDESVELFADIYKEDDSSIMVTYNNHLYTKAQDSVMNLNKAVRKILQPNSQESVVDGDKLVMYSENRPPSGYRDSNDMEDNVPFINSGVVNIISASEITSKVFNIVIDPRNRGTVNIEVEYQDVQIEGTNDAGNKQTVTRKVPTKKGKDVIIKMSKQWAVKGSFPKYYKFLENTFGKEFLETEYAYAVTSHKAQGSSYNNVVVMADNINRGVNSGNRLSRKRSMYVAVSRPKQNLIIQTSHNFNSIPKPITKTKEVIPEPAGEFDYYDQFDDEYFKGSSDSTNTGTVLEDEFKLDMRKQFVGAYVNMLQEDIGEGTVNPQVDGEFIKAKIDVVKQMQKFFEANFESYKADIGIGTATDKTKGTFRSKNDKLGVNDRIDIFSNEKDKSTGKSEILLHEALHSMAKGISNRNPKVFNRLKELRTHVRESKDVIAEDFLPIGVTNGIATDSELRIAKEKYDYIMTDNADIEEFFAYSMSNPALFNALGKTEIVGKEGFLEMVKSMVRKLFSSINTEDNGIAVVNKTMEDIMKFQQGVMAENPNVLINSKYENLAVVGKLVPLANMTFKSGRQMTRALQTLGFPINKTLVESIAKLFKLQDSIIDKIKSSSGSAIEEISKIPIIGDIIKAGLIQSLFRSLFEDTANGRYKDFYTMFRKGKEVVNKVTLDIKSSVKKLVSEKDLEHINNIDLNYEVTEKLVNTGLLRMLPVIKGIATEDALNSRLSELSTSVYENLNVNQRQHTDALVKHIIDGKSHIHNQQINSYNIINSMFLVETDGVELTNKVTMKSLDEYIALQVLKQTNGMDTLLKVEERGLTKDVEALSRMYSQYYNKYVTEHAEAGRFLQIPFNFVANENSKGEYKMTLLSEEELLTADRFGIRDIDEDNPIMLGGVPYYKAKRTDIDIPYEEGAIKLTNIQPAGVSVKEYIYAAMVNSNTEKGSTRSLHEVQQNVNKFIEEYSKNPNKVGKLLDLGNNGAIPRYSNNGSIVDYIIPYSNSEKVTTLEHSNTIMETIPYSISRLVAMDIAKKNNIAVVNTLIDFKNSEDENVDSVVNFSWVGAKSKGELSKAWDLFPADLKQYILKTTGKNGISIPDAVLNQIVGYKSASISNISVFGKGIESKPMKDAILIGEKIVKDTLGHFKGVLIKFNPNIFIGNLISNMMVAWGYGISPVQYYKSFMSNWDLLRDYEATNSTLRNLQIRKVAGENVDGQLKVIKSKLSKSKFKALIDDGQFTPLIEDMDTSSTSILGNTLNARIGDNLRSDNSVVVNGVDVSDVVLRNSYIQAKKEFAKEDNKLTFEEILEDTIVMSDEGKVSATQYNAFKFIYGLKGSSSEEFASRVVTYGDTITRQIILEKRMKELGKKKRENVDAEYNEDYVTKADEQQILNELDQLIVNYSYVDNKYQSWMEKVGGLFFLKYLLKSQKGYRMFWQKNPLVAGFQQGMQNALGVDVADPLDTVVGKNFADSIANREQLDDPLHVLWESLTPNVGMPVTQLQMDSIYK